VKILAFSDLHHSAKQAREIVAAAQQADLVIGAGGLGSPLILYLAAAGVGTIGVMDDDVVDLSNLQRQILHTTDQIGNLKTSSTQDMIRRINQIGRAHV